MSSVSGSDGSNYNYFQKQFSDLSDDFSAERKKAKERENERIDELERRHAQELRETEESHNRSLSHAKDASNKALASEHETSKEDYDRLKRDTYDRYGRMNQDQGSEARRTIEDLQHTIDTQKSRHDEELHQAEENYQAHLSEREKQANNEAQKSVEMTRDDLDQTHGNAMRIEHERNASAMAGANRRYQDLDKSRLEDMEQQRRRYDGALDEAQLGYNRRLELARNAYDKSTTRQEANLRDSRLDDADLLRMSHERESRELRGKIGDLIQAEKGYMKNSAQGKADAVHQYESEWMDRMAVMDANNKHEVQDLHNQNERMEAYLGRQNNTNLREKDDYFAHLLNQQNAEHQTIQHEQMNSYLADREQMLNNFKHERDTQDKLVENRIENVARESNRTLQNQAKTLGENANNEHKIDAEQMARLQAALTERQTSADTSLISPAAEAAMRRQIAGQYEKTSQADQQRRQRENEQIRSDYKDTLRTTVADGQTKEMRLNRKVASDMNDERSRFNSHVADLEYMKDSAIRDKQTEQDREREKLSKTYGRMLDRQGRDSEESMSVAKSDAATRMAAQREEFEFNQKMAQREYSLKLNETIRDYGKKLSDQKSEYELQLQDQKAAAATAAREADRKLKNMLDQQQRNYDQKLAQTEAQHKERERYIQQNYQEELEKVKRANAMLIQRRG